jgi:hypothetical protein
MKVKPRPIAAAITVLATLAALLTVPAAPASAATLDAHWLGALDGGALYHSIRRANGSWTALGNVLGANGTSVAMTETAGAVIYGELHVLGADRNGGLWHSIRRRNGSWTGFTAVFPFAGDPGEVQKVAAAAIGGVLHVLVITNWELSYTVRRGDGSWEPFRPIHPIHPDADPPREVAAVEAPGGALHIVVLGSDFDVYHRVRWDNGTWSPFISLGIPAYEVVVDVAIAADLWGVHVALITDHPHVNVVDTKVFHRMRNSDGSWTPWGWVTEPNIQLTQIGATGFYSNEVQLTVSGTYGEVFHVLRRSDGTWTPWGQLARRTFGGDVEMAGEW